MDIAAFRRRSDAVAAQALTGHAADGDTVDGPAKVAQWAVSQLFSRAAVTPFRETEGTPLAAALTGGGLATDADVFAAFSAAAARVLSVAAGVETSATPDAERLRSLSLTRLTLAPGRLTMTVTVGTGAAAARDLVVALDLTTA